MTHSLQSPPTLRPHHPLLILQVTHNISIHRHLLLHINRVSINNHIRVVNQLRQHTTPSTWVNNRRIPLNSNSSTEVKLDTGIVLWRVQLVYLNIPRVSSDRCNKDSRKRTMYPATSISSNIPKFRSQPRCLFLRMQRLPKVEILNSFSNKI